MQAGQQDFGLQPEVALELEGHRRHDADIGQRPGAARLQAADRFGRQRRDEVEGEQQIGLALAEPLAV